jgi:hypothetical protein
MNYGIMYLSQWSKPPLTKYLMCLKAFNEVTAKYYFIIFFNLL